MNPDRIRLAPSRLKVAAVMADEGWHRTDELCEAVGLRNLGTLTSRIRDLAAYGGYEYEKRPTEIKGLYEYRLFTRMPEQLTLLEGEG